MSMQDILRLMQNPQIKALMNSQNPQQMALNMIKNSPNANTEIGRNIINMIEHGDTKGLEQYGKNLIQSQGMNPDDVQNMLKNMPK